MQRNSSEIEAAIDGAIAATEDLMGALPLASGLDWDGDAAVLHFSAWGRAIEAQRDLVRAAIAQHDDGPERVAA